MARVTQHSKASVGDWPTREDYDRAILDRARNVYDPDIRAGDLLHDATGPIHLDGGRTCVYRTGDWIVRCLIGHPPADLEQRYLGIGTYLATYSIEHPGADDGLITYTYVPKGIKAAGRDWPLIKSKFVRGEGLGAFLEERHREQGTVTRLAERWLALITRLEMAEIAHGDLDLTNVLVSGTPPDVDFTLIDYDAMFVPTLAGLPLTEDGHEHFQPARRGVRAFNRKMDRFSALVIYLSLVALAHDPSLWRECQADEASRLLVGAEDFADPGVSQRFFILERKGGPVARLCVAALRTSIEQARMPPALPDVLSGPALTRGPAQVSRPITLQPPVPIGTAAAAIVIPTSQTIPLYQQSGKGYQPAPSQSTTGWPVPVAVAQSVAPRPLYAVAPTVPVSAKGASRSGAPTSGGNAGAKVAWAVTIVTFLLVILALLVVVNYH